MVREKNLNCWSVFSSYTFLAQTPRLSFHYNWQAAIEATKKAPLLLGEVLQLAEAETER